MIRFGPAGNSEAFYESGLKHTYQAPQWLNTMGLNAFEYSFGRGIKLKEDTGEKIAQEAEKYNVHISVHAPYYINLANDKFETNLEYIRNSIICGGYMKAKRVVFHPGSCLKLTREQAFANTVQTLKNVIKELKNEGLTETILCAETMGKLNQIGDLQEVCELVNLDDTIYPAIDFGHLNARTLGGLKSLEDFENVLNYMEKTIAKEKYQNMHVHFSHIEYTEKGEKMHLTFEDEKWGPDFDNLAKLIVKRKLTPVIICESNGTQAIDAKAMKDIYENYNNT